MGSIRFRVVDDKVEEIHKIVVHRFRISDVDDPEIYAAEPLWEWQQSEQGQFVMTHAIDAPVFHKNLNQSSFEYEYAIVAELEKKKLTEYYLKFGPINKGKL